MSASALITTAIVNVSVRAVQGSPPGRPQRPLPASGPVPRSAPNRWPASSSSARRAFLKWLDSVRHGFIQRLVDDLLQLGGQLRIELRRRHRRISQDRGKGLRTTGAGEGLPPRRHFVKHSTKAEDVRARVKLLAPRLFRRLVGRRRRGLRLFHGREDLLFAFFQ